MDTCLKNCHGFVNFVNEISSKDKVQSRTLTLHKKLSYLLIWKPFKNDQKCFSFSRYFLSWILGHVEKTDWL